MTYGEAIREALYQEMKNDSSVIMFGEDIRYNLYGYTGGLYKEFGDRVIDVPLMENTIVGMAIGASLRGLRPIVDLTVANFLYTAMDQIVNMASKLRSMCNYDVPITIMCAEMDNMGSQHSDRPHEMFRMIQGLKIATPSTPQEAYSMLRNAIRDNDPVIYFSDRSKFYNKENIICEQY
jgi:pyruvate/2-oxoglutarate/acetoin dehydrogenase E1 component